jgi:hypothetical protein
VPAVIMEGECSSEIWPNQKKSHPEHIKTVKKLSLNARAQNTVPAGSHRAVTILFYSSRTYSKPAPRASYSMYILVLMLLYMYSTYSTIHTRIIHTIIE